MNIDRMEWIALYINNELIAYGLYKDIEKYITVNSTIVRL